MHGTLHSTVGTSYYHTLRAYTIYSGIFYYAGQATCLLHLVMPAYVAKS